MTTPPSSAAPSGGPRTLPGPRPERILAYAWTFASSRALASALESSLFTRIARGSATAAELSHAAGASERGTSMLLDALVAMGLVAREGSGTAARHALAPDADAFLVEGREGYIGDFVLMHDRLVRPNWDRLAECVRSGEPVAAVDRPEEGDALWQELVGTLLTVNRAAAHAAAEELARLHAGPLRILDVAAGSGVWGIAAARARPDVRVVAFDLASTLEITRRTVEREGLAERIELAAGDLREADLGREAYEAAILGHILHSEGPEHSRRLLAKVARALVPGGTVVIAEFVPDPDRGGPLLPVLFALNMLVHTSEGTTFTLRELEGMLGEAGFDEVRTLPAPAPSPLVLATRRR
jgi:ubiquinone/menaquinone biosynthesis C-methylase UbiE